MSEDIYRKFNKNGIYKIYKKSPMAYKMTLEEFEEKYRLYPYCTAERGLQKIGIRKAGESYTMQYFLLHSKQYINTRYELMLDNKEASYLNDFEKRLLIYLNMSFLQNIYKVQRDKILVDCDDLNEIGSFLISTRLNCIYIDKQEIASLLGLKDLNQSSYDIEKSLRAIARHLYSGVYKDKSKHLAKFSTITIIDSIEATSDYFIVKLGSTYASLLTLGTAIPYFLGFLVLNEKNNKRVRATGEYLEALEHIQRKANNRGRVTIGSLKIEIGKLTIEKRKGSEAKAIFRIMNTLKAIGFLKDFSFIIKDKSKEQELKTIKELANVENINNVIIKYSSFLA